MNWTLNIVFWAPNLTHCPPLTHAHHVHKEHIKSFSELLKPPLISYKLIKGILMRNLGIVKKRISIQWIFYMKKYYKYIKLQNYMNEPNYVLIKSRKFLSYNEVGHWNILTTEIKNVNIFKSFLKAYWKAFIYENVCKFASTIWICRWQTFNYLFFLYNLVFLVFVWFFFLLCFTHALKNFSR